MDFWAVKGLSAAHNPPEVETQLHAASFILPGSARINRDGDHWVVVDSGLRLSRAGAWDAAPLPSSRTDEWIAAHAWPSLDAAHRAYLHAMEVG